ncbi:AEG_G0026460.mRNA.1.CDS.1 [Saccharomyces cerevisiae]|uniref:Aminopeptidase n=1 Tax=Saccharomyces cerevisiae (strain JAY291) TaxID=574961 RepID=C7GUQ5_YEAS2|nr:Tma108p [Saccharomyces cerevisiae JAY291]CAE6494456.1 Tma108p [Saccharomyces cerevisiae PE-2]CAI4393354.1 AEG_G0026460.mRNA.1.CDS.1 [Saccharomyces cerevisiae]CAF1581460.1 Tma108p [Saccharomyces cerevisiae PE-2]CAI4397875.1 AEH_G0026220.mRNA.1.CDS.1 [Saccharomyces cerevisiae]
MSDNLLSLENPVVPSHYELRLEIDPKQSSPNFKGSAIIHLKFNPNSTTLASIEDSFTQFKLHSKDLIVLSAHATIGSTKFDLKISQDTGKHLSIFNSESPIQLSNDCPLILSVQYVGKIRDIKTHHDKTFGIFKTNFMDRKTGTANNHVVATHCQPFSASNIFPCIDEPSNKSTFQLNIATDSQYKAVSNTPVEMVEALDSSQKHLVKFAKTPLMTTSVFGFSIGDLEFLKTEIKLEGDRTIPVSIYAPWDIANAAFTLDTVQKYLPLLESYFKCPYPLPKLDFVLLPYLSDMAMENFGMITIQLNHLLIPPNALANESVREQAQQLIVHELVHQWMGNYISFDSWESLWFNESFATWLACHILEQNGDLSHYWTSEPYLLQQVEPTMCRDAADVNGRSIFQIAQRNTGIDSQTSDIFDPEAYTKGIIMLRSLQLATGESHLQKGLESVFEDTKTFHARSVKPMDIWNHIGKFLKSQNITNFVSSWTRTPGLPVVKVEVEEKDGKTQTKLTQHRFINQLSTEEKDQLEDVPYQVPLFGVLPDGKMDTKNVLLTDRTLTLDYPILVINHLAQGYYRVSYESEECYALINDKITEETLSEIDLRKIFLDLSQFIGDEGFQNSIHLHGLFKILNHIASPSTKIASKYWDPLSKGLEVLQTIDRASLTSSKLQSFLKKKIVIPLFNKIDWPHGEFDKSTNPHELKVMSQVLFLNKNSAKCAELCQIYFKHLLQGPRSSVPLELVNSILVVVLQHCANIKQWKKIFDLVKRSSCTGITNHVINMYDQNSSETAMLIQNGAIESLGFCLDSDIVKKTLNFITSNIESEGMELALFGFNYNFKKRLNKNEKPQDQVVRETIWEWYMGNFDQWARKATRKGTTTGDHLHKALRSISLIIFQMFVADEPQKIEKFINLEKEKLGQSLLSLDDIWASVQQDEESRKTIRRDLASLV